MAIYTTNYELKKPQDDDFFDVADQNGNMDIIDGALNTLDTEKVDKVAGKILSSNDYTTAEKTKLANLSNYDDTELAQTVNGKVDKISGKSLSTNDYTTAEKTKLSKAYTTDDIVISETQPAIQEGRIWIKVVS